MLDKPTWLDAELTRAGGHGVGVGVVYACMSEPAELSQTRILVR